MNPTRETRDPDERSRTEKAGQTHTDKSVCEICGGPVLERHCKIQCQNCGYQRDCSDP